MTKSSLFSEDLVTSLLLGDTWSSSVHLEFSVIFLLVGAAIVERTSAQACSLFLSVEPSLGCLLDVFEKAVLRLMSPISCNWIETIAARFASAKNVNPAAGSRGEIARNWS